MCIRDRGEGVLRQLVILGRNAAHTIEIVDGDGRRFGQMAHHLKVMSVKFHRLHRLLHPVEQLQLGRIFGKGGGVGQHQAVDGRQALFLRCV